jgi:urease accessory protein
MTSRWQGKLNLVYTYQDQMTSINKSFCQAPLKKQQDFYPEGKEICHSVIIHTAGGIVGGDLLTQNIHLQPNSQVLITNPTATKVYKSDNNLAEYQTKITLEENTFLEYLPLETIIFNGAHYRQNLQINLSEKAAFLAWEINRFGRTASQEKFITGHWRSQTEIYQNNEPIWIDRQEQLGDETLINSPNSLGGKPLIATLIYVGKPVSKEVINQARELGKNSLNLEVAEFGVTHTLTDGLLCRYRGYSTREVKNWLIQIWELLRYFHCERKLIKPRIWS